MGGVGSRENGGVDGGVATFQEGPHHPWAYEPVGSSHAHCFLCHSQSESSLLANKWLISVNLSISSWSDISLRPFQDLCLCLS